MGFDATWCFVVVVYARSPTKSVERVWIVDVVLEHYRRMAGSLTFGNLRRPPSERSTGPYPFA